LAQFEIKPLIPIRLGEIDVSFTNSALFMVIAVVIATGFLMLGTRRSALVPGRLQSVAELSYEFIANMVRDNVGQEGRKYFPFIFTLFMFVFFGNPSRWPRWFSWA
jgi:F-type H+-transporting ATPase subunit a